MSSFCWLYAYLRHSGLARHGLGIRLFSGLTYETMPQTLLRGAILMLPLLPLRVVTLLRVTSWRCCKASGMSALLSVSSFCLPAAAQEVLCASTRVIRHGLAAAVHVQGLTRRLRTLSLQTILTS